MAPTGPSPVTVTPEGARKAHRGQAKASSSQSMDTAAE